MKNSSSKFRKLTFFGHLQPHGEQLQQILLPNLGEIFALNELAIYTLPNFR